MKKIYAVNVTKLLNDWNTMSYVDYEKMMLMQKKYKKKFIESLLFHEWCMFKVEKVSIFSKFHYNRYVLRATSVLC